MKNFLKITLVLVSTVSGFAQDVSIIQGQIVGLKNCKVYLYSTKPLGGGSQLVDSVRLSGQFFSFKRPIKEPAGYILSIDDTFGQFYFIWDKDLFISLNADDLNQSKVEESPLNELLQSFADTLEIACNRRLKEVQQAMSQMEQANNSQQLYMEYLSLQRRLSDLTVSFIRLHRESWAGLFTLLTYHKSIGRKQSLDLLNIINQNFHKSQLYIQLKEKVNDSSYMMLP